MTVHNSYNTTYDPQTNKKLERYNRTILAVLRTYVTDGPKDWDLYTDALTYAYNNQPHTSKFMAPFELVLSNPPGPLAIEPIPTKAMAANDFKLKWKHWLMETLPKTKKST